MRYILAILITILFIVAFVLLWECIFNDKFTGRMLSGWWGCCIFQHIIKNKNKLKIWEY